MLHFRLHGGESATPEEIKEFCKGQVDYEVNLILKRFFFCLVSFTFTLLDDTNLVHHATLCDISNNSCL